jgi:Carbohydrate-binding module 48 (Isoamylase N-terminal domain)
MVARYTGVMDPNSELRNMAKQQYASIRRELADFEDRVMARYWDEDTPIRVSFRWFLGWLDQCAGWLPADDETRSSGAPDLKEQEDTQLLPDEAEAPVTARTVDVTFTLPAEVQAERVALCGEFNGWSAEDTQLERGGDGTWRVTVALEPGRSYRYRYLLDGERWENAWQADRYVANPYGGVDSVVVVEPDS